ncbi:PAS domain-containing protein [Fodinibius sp. N2]|uniref:PAS domain-containing protein n=1 Tax=Fodinibius alkaliphilus TaxID=3140241 RepID=UPI00315A560B
MGQSYQILLIEDDDEDVKQIKAELNKVDSDIQLQVISTKQELINCLKEAPPQLIICDYDLHNITGIEALTYVQENSPNLPFILVSESIGEDKAVDAMLKGASDYVMKNDLSRLCPAIIREITNYEEHKAQQSRFEETQSRYESLIQSVNGIVWEADADTFAFQYISPQANDILGYSPEEWLNTSDFWQNHIHPEDREEATKFCHHQTKQGNDHSFEYRMLSSNNEIVWIRDYVSVIYEDGQPSQLRGLMVDISKEKQTEFQRDKAYEIADIGHWELDLIHDNLFWSDAVKSLHEVDQNFELDLETALDFYKEDDHRRKITNAIEQAIETGTPFDVELKIITAGGNERWVRAVGEPEFRNGTCVRIYGSTQDITARKEVERKLRDVVEHSTNMFYRHDTNHVLSYVSPQSKDFLGYPPEEAKQKWTEFATDHPINKKGFEYTQQAIYTGQTQPPFELQLQKKDGDIIWVLVNEAPIVEGGETVAIVGSLTDITDQKEYEKKIKETNKKLKAAQNIAKLGYWKLDLQTDEVYWSKQAYDIWEINPNQPIDMDVILTHMHPNDRDAFIKENEKTLTNHQPLNFQHRILLPGKSYKWVEVMGTIETASDGTPISLEGTVQDITEKKELELLLNQTNRLARVGSWEIDLTKDKSKQVFWSEMTREILEVKPDYNPTLEKAIKFYEPNSRKRIQKSIDKAINEGIAFDLELLVKTATGNKRWVRSIGQPEFIDGECVRIYGSYQDIHDRKTSELELERRNEFIETTLNNLPIGIAVNQIDNGKKVLMNPQFSKIYGWPEKVLNDKDTFFEKVYPDGEYREQIKDQILTDIQSGDPERMQWSNIKITTQNGDQRIVNSKNIPLPDQNLMISTVVDVTAEKEAEREKIQILERIDDAFFALDENWVVTYWNNKAEELLEMPREQILGENLWEIYDDAITLDFYPKYHKALTEQVTVQFEEHYPPLDKWFEVNAYPSETGLSVYFRDITEQKKSHARLLQLNQELEDHAEELAAANKELEQFAYVASHDLQEPLRMVSSFLKRLEKKYAHKLDDTAQQYIDFAVDGSQRMRRIILDLLNYSRIDQNDHKKQEVNLNKLIDEIKKLEHTRLQEKSAIIHCDDLPTIEAAQTPIQQVFQNLLNNAIKYTKEDTTPEVHISCEEHNNYWKFSITDNGIGIKKEFQDKIFTIFQRLHTQEEYAGTGIGLAISRKIVEKHGGEIWVDSKEGEGSTFYFTIRKY